MRSLPTVSSHIPPDLRQFLDRVREALSNTGPDQLVTARQLVAAGVASFTGSGRIDAPGTVYQAPYAPTGLSASGALANIMVTWDFPMYSGHAYTEVWAAQAPAGGGVPALGDAVLVGMAPGGMFVHNIGSAATRWYWVRFVNLNGVVGPYSATDGVAGSTGQDPGYLLAVLTGEISNSQLAQALASRIDLIDGADTLPGSVNARIATEATNRADADSALATQVTTMSASVSSAANGVVSLESSMQVHASALAGLNAQYTLKIDAAGHVSGFGLASTGAGAEATSEFAVRADRFWVAPPEGSPFGAVMPFVIQVVPTTVNGVPVPAGVYMDSSFIKNGTITTAQIGNATIDMLRVTGSLAVDRLSAGSLTAGTYVRSANYVSGHSGWTINANGYAEFSDGVFRGSLEAATGTFAGSVNATGYVKATQAAPSGGVNCAVLGEPTGGGVHGVGGHVTHPWLAGVFGLSEGSSGYGVYGESRSSGAGVTGKCDSGADVDCAGSRKLRFGSDAAYIRYDGSYFRASDASGTDRYVLLGSSALSPGSAAATLGNCRPGGGSAMSGWLELKVAGSTVYIPYWG